jgi:hypothetical protein
MLRHFWALIEATQANLLLSLDDKGLIQWLLRQIKDEQPLDTYETSALAAYIQSKLSLIRDLAHERVVSHPFMTQYHAERK